MVTSETLYHIFKYPWTTIALSSWKKYPHPSRPDVENVDLIRKDFDEKSGTLQTTRLLTMKLNQLPSWFERILGNASPRAYFIEDTFVDPKNKIMILSSRNVTFEKIVRLDEICTYTIDPNNGQWTQMKQEAKVTAFPPFISHKIEEACVGTFKQNASRVDFSLFF
eukprot:TRINITY_DN4245_c0_g1_i2.p1 TRINITY_DN4245_c0_g1~~TRINITY_DN4245_c0_g1_i2.p1  ORF type:complete len:166 (+),score=36.37 TRINITY_DN4245_c0_g1_i2:209-706(+)